MIVNTKIWSFSIKEMLRGTISFGFSAEPRITIEDKSFKETKKESAQPERMKRVNPLTGRKKRLPKF